jgi:hypothetical protein
MIAICPEIKRIVAPLSGIRRTSFDFVSGLPQNHSAYLSCFGCGQRPRWEIRWQFFQPLEILRVFSVFRGEIFQTLEIACLAPEGFSR